jgi:hypothetical protein
MCFMVICFGKASALKKQKQKSSARYTNTKKLSFLLIILICTPKEYEHLHGGWKKIHFFCVYVWIFYVRTQVFGEK